ncbi:MAG TPA: type II secretion system protein GspC [Steroidobacteraceae bacterium]|nr:type II secretion system protein GspC [Steroidobacteraceae bacterium]
MNAVSSWLDAMHAPDKLASTLRSRAPQVAVWALALALGVQAALIVTHLAGAGAPPAAAAQSQPAAVPMTRAPDVAAITNAHLFGAPPVAPSGSAADAPRTTMALVLTATLAAHDRKTGELLPDRGLAILGPNSGAANVYVVGDNVPGGARLHAVYDDRVLLDRNGSLESLMLPKQVQGEATAPIPTRTSFPAERVRELITQNPAVIADVIRPQPVFAGGKQRGYRVYPGRNRQAFLRLGLRPGDLVVAINDTPLDDPARGEEIFGTLASSSEARVTVMRNGRQQDLTLNMSQIASEADQLAGEEAQSGGSAQGAPPRPSTLGAPVPPARH